MYENRNYCIVSTNELSKIDFSQVCQTSAGTVQRSKDGGKALIKWDSVEIPSSVVALLGASQVYTHMEILQVLAQDEWSSAESES